MFCCEDFLHIGCFKSCKCVSTDILAEQSGTYVFEYSYSHSGVHYSQILNNVQIGDVLRLPFETNESSTFFFKIKAPDGSYVEKDGYSCFCATIKVNRVVGASDYDTPCGVLPSGIGVLTLEQEITIPVDGGTILRVSFVSPPNYDYTGFKISIGRFSIETDSRGSFYTPLPPGNYIIDVETISTKAVFPKYSFAFSIL